MNTNNQKIKTRTLEEYYLVKKIKKEKKAHGIIKISRLTGIPTNTVRDWIYRGVKPKRLRKTKILPEKAKKLSPELSYILGVIQGDGCLCKAKRKSLPGENYDYILTLGVTDKDFAEYFSKKVEEWCFFKPYNVKYPPRGKGTKDVYIVRLRSKDAYEFLSNFDLNTILESNDEVKGMFLKGFYDSEGCVSKNLKSRNINVGNINFQTMTLVRKLLKLFNIASRINIRDIEGYNRFYYINIASKINLSIFKDKIGFSIKRKQDRLNYLVQSLPVYK